MTLLAAVLAAGLLAGPAASSSATPPGTGDVSIEAGSITWDAASGRYRLEDGAVIRRGVVTLRARSAALDPESGEVDATGDVLLTDATRAVAAAGVHAVLDGPFEATGVTAFVKEGAVDLSAAATLEDARRAGRNRATLSGARIAGDARGRLSVNDARLTLCDCGGDAPSWQVRARRAEVIPGKSAVLSWPVLYVTPRILGIDRPVPVLPVPVPWLLLPLGDRHTGLLFPLAGSTGASGFSIAEPAFVTLGRSADATITPEYHFGRSRTAFRDGKAAVRGPGLRLEGRVAPAPGSEGRLELAWVNDLDREAGGAGGGRLALVGEHAQRLGASARARLDLALASDPLWWRDFTAGLLQRDAFYRRSTLLVSRRSDALVLEASAAYLQPLTPAAWTEVVDRSDLTRTLPRPSYGTLGSGVDVLHRWPSASATLLPLGAGPLAISGRAGVARFAPVNGRGSGISGPGDPGARPRTLAFDGVPVTFLDVDGRASATRADARLELRAPLLLGRALTFEPWVRGAAVGYAFDEGEPVAALWAVGGASLSTELSRRFGALEHRIAPRVEYRAITAPAGLPSASLDLFAYDLWDRVRGARTAAVQVAPGAVGEVVSPFVLSAAPPERVQQLRLSVENRLLAGPAQRLRVELGQDLDLERGKLAETFLSVAGGLGPVSADVAGRVLAFEERPGAAPSPRYGSWLDDFTDLRAGVTLASRRGNALRVGLLAVGAGGSGALVAGVDPLFDLRVAPVEALAQGDVGARVVMGGATIGYDALLPARPTDVARCSGGLGETRRVQGWQVQQHTGTVVWDSPCRCFLARLVVRLTDCGEVSYSAAIDLSRLGERASLR